MRHDPRGPSDRHAEERLRVALAAVLGFPVIALVIGESLARRIGLNRPAALSVGLVAGTLAISALSTAAMEARSTTAPTPVVDRQSRALRLPIPIRDVAPIVQHPPASATDEPPVVTPTAGAPSVVRFRPRDGWTGVSRFTAISVRFSKPMDHASTEAAFRAVLGDRRITGIFRWAEGDTVLVLKPARALPDGARIALSVEIGARATDGGTLARTRSVAFTVQRRAATTERRAGTSGPVRRSTGWRWPLVGPITQRFGESLTKYGFHYGIDIDGRTGDPVRAARRGRVIVAGSYDSCGGLEIHIDHGDGIASWYRHLSRIQVTPGTFVEAGTVIGRVGNTGCSLGSHLHFAIRKGPRFVDPLDYLPPPT